MKSLNKSQTGFTLVELLGLLFVIGVAVAAGWHIFGSSIRDQYQQVVSETAAEFRRQEKQVADFCQYAAEVNSRDTKVQFDLDRNKRELAKHLESISSIDAELRNLLDAMKNGTPVREAVTKRELPPEEIGQRIELREAVRQSTLDLVSTLQEAIREFEGLHEQYQREIRTAPVRRAELETILANTKSLYELHKRQLETVDKLGGTIDMEEMYRKAKADLNTLKSKFTRSSIGFTKLDFGKAEAKVDQTKQNIANLERILSNSAK